MYCMYDDQRNYANWLLSKRKSVLEMVLRVKITSIQGTYLFLCKKRKNFWFIVNYNIDETVSSQMLKRRDSMVLVSLMGLPVVSYPWIFRTQTIRTQAQTFRTHFRSVLTQPSGRFVPNKLWHKMFKTNIRNYFIYPSNRKTIKMHACMCKVYVGSYFLSSKQRCIQVFKLWGPLDPFWKNLGVHC